MSAQENLHSELDAAVNELVTAVEWTAYLHDTTPDTLTVEAAADHLAEKLENEVRLVFRIGGPTPQVGDRILAISEPLSNGEASEEP